MSVCECIREYTRKYAGRVCNEANKAAGNKNVLHATNYTDNAAQLNLQFSISVKRERERGDRETGGEADRTLVSFST